MVVESRSLLGKSFCNTNHLNTFESNCLTCTNITYHTIALVQERR